MVNEEMTTSYTSTIGKKPDGVRLRIALLLTEEEITVYLRLRKKATHQLREFQTLRIGKNAGTVP